MAFQQLRPLKIEEIPGNRLAIDWADGHRSLHAFRRLRLACGCAFCKDEHSGRRLIQPEQVAEDIRPRAITPVGTYALRFDWSDGHATGIYPFDLLRHSCECDACAGGQTNAARH